MPEPLTDEARAEIEALRERPFSVRLDYSQEDKCWFVRYPNLPGCLADGDTPEEALRNGEGAKAVWISSALKHGVRIPEPSNGSDTQAQATVREHTRALRERMDRRWMDPHCWSIEEQEAEYDLAGACNLVDTLTADATRLRAALNNTARWFIGLDGKPCWCERLEGRIDNHDRQCAQARAALAGSGDDAA